MSARQRLPMELALLGFLMREPMHGYDLHRQVKEALGRIWYMGLSNIYSALKRLETAGRVEPTFTPQDGRPPRKVYSITPRGQEAFLKWVQTPVPSIRDMRVEFPTKLYFFRILDLDGVEVLISGQEAACQKRIERLERHIDRCTPDDFNRLVFDFRRRQIQAILHWLISCREEWERWTNPSQENDD